ncbi:hypothetical protein PNEG_00434 [Pneumocystis murina B123]|uniref:Uncharacterized protein n=1 Tax=Pneumocystis murina (strain B123) TaxID=1069680 RepID=M7NW98_PNEMU|nr:hypothetical protein PNEG_00434 [Pneumocystis murina B123]EMR11411.1 hypothetical protein PNEG_00434 [Pneumocystis murina B123]
MRFIRVTHVIWVKRRIRCISTRTFEIQTIGALTRKAEETNLLKIQEIPVKNKENVKKSLLERLKGKKINILAKPLMPGILPYDESKVSRGLKNGVLKKDYMGFPWPDEAKYVDSDLAFYEDLSTEKKDMKTIKKCLEYDNLSVSLKDSDRELSIKSKKNIKEENKMLKDEFNLKMDDYEKNQRIYRSPIIRKGHSKLDMFVSRLEFVSKEDLDPYMPDWVISSKKINILKSKDSVPKQFREMDKELKKMNVKSNEGNLDCKNIFYMNDSTFFNNCIYKNSSIKPNQKIEMINIINEMIKQKTV